MNLLTVFHVLMEERSVTRAGERLGRTQSAVSNALKRLRDRFEDPLFVRTPEGLSPTPRAADLAPVVARILRDAENVASRPDDFDPSVAEARFIIGAPDRFSLPVFVPLFERLGRIAPKIGIHLRTTDRDYAIRLIDSGDIQIAMGWFDSTPPHIRRLFAFEDRFVCLCRADHPLIARGAHLELEDILAYAHLVVSSTGDQRAAFDAVLERHGCQRTIAMTVMSFTIVPELLMRSDLVGVFTNRTAEYLARRNPLAIAEVPLEMAPIANHLIWHNRMTADKAHSWLRQELHRAWSTPA
ncbi:LysR family transcriptional regulator [Yangia mangrovi]|uniref:LysR family transcriptional regulator n=2 Tax=Alloyangia mangrovi TaxID=1779329 RepID=A0A2A3JRB1_9RHOB|nr:LysR family transcriptional regulator [Alloyangia mangrovi]MCT4370952.1 LysR family transcriptional regulator [Alloyangia mangrovi]